MKRDERETCGRLDVANSMHPLHWGKSIYPNYSSIILKMHHPADRDLGESTKAKPKGEEEED